MSHSTLPIRSLLDPGTAHEQHERWISDDPMRFYWAQEEKAKWREYFIKAEKNPVGPNAFIEEAQQKIVWWKEFLFDGLKVYRAPPDPANNK